MNVQELIESGALELYVYGVLPPEEMVEITRFIHNHPELKAEVERIEQSIIQLSSSFSPNIPSHLYDKMRENWKQVPASTVSPPSGTSFLKCALFGLLGIAASIFFWSNLQKSKSELQTIKKQNQVLIDSIQEFHKKDTQHKHLFAAIKHPDNLIIPLAGQKIAAHASARVYWNKSTKEVIVDATGLPEPPPGKVYQVWALKLNPLTPTSIGLLNEFSSNEIRMFVVENASAPQAFGITLEPEGGSSTPTLEQLYTLGAI